MQKHQQISHELRLEIAAGKFEPSGRLPSEAQLVERFAVSRPTVARALQDLQKEGLIERRAGSGSFVRENTAAESRLLGLLVPGRGSTEIFDLICGEVGALARLHGYGLLWGRSAHPLLDRTLDAQLAHEACEQFIRRGVRGVIFAPFEHLEDNKSVNLALLDLLRQAGIPVVLIDRDPLPFPLRSDYDLIGLDNVQAGFLAADHLIRLGCRELRMLVDPGSASTIDARLAGIREALQTRGIPISPDIKVAGDPTDPDFVRQSIGGGAVDAVICANDFTAARLLKTLAQLGLAVPGDLRVVGFDDVRYATLVSVSLTTVRQPCRDIALAAFRALEDRIRDATAPTRTIHLSPTLVVRDSCGAYAQPPLKRRPKARRPA